MNLKKQYIKPEIFRFDIDNTISLVMMTDIPPNPGPRGAGGKRSGSGKGLKRGMGDDVPFKSPFGDKPFE